MKIEILYVAVFTMVLTGMILQDHEIRHLRQTLHDRDSVLNARMQQIYDQEMLIKTLTVQHEDDEQMMQLMK